MYKRILVPTDGSELSKKAIQAAVRLAAILGAHITGIFAAKEYPVPPFVRYPPPHLINPEAFRQMQEARALSALTEISREAREAGVPFDVIVRTSDEPYKAIADAAQELGCDLICMASHGRRGASAKVLGSETAKVLVHSSIPVLVYR